MAPNTSHTVVAFADVHLDRRFAWADRGAAARRRLAIRRSLAAIVDLAERVDADALLCGGDLFETDDFTPDTAAFVADLFDCGRPVLAAHLAPTGTPGFFESFDADRLTRVRRSGEQHLALFHGSELRGLALQGTTKVGHAPFEAADIERAGFDYAFVGHYHRSFIGPRHCYPGNPDPLEFGEDAPRGAIVATVGDDGSVSCEVHPVAQTSCVSVDVDVTACRSFTDVVDFAACALRGLDGFVRVDLVGSLDPAVTFSVEDLHASLPASVLDKQGGIDGLLIRRDGLRRRYDLEAMMSEPFSVRARFLDLVSADSELDPADRDLIIEMGLRAFDDQTDLQVL